MLDFDKMREQQLHRVNTFEASCMQYAIDCPVIIELLESHEMTQYRLFGMHKGDLESMEHIAHSLHHAFIDDGSWHVSRKVDKQSTDFRTRINNLMTEKGKLDKITEEVVYTYSLKGGDSDTNMDIEEKHLSEMIRVDALHYKYYDDNKEAIERRGVLIH